jgi:excisionase family DNA binding protein
MKDHQERQTATEKQEIILFPMHADTFWQQMRRLVESVVEEKLAQQYPRVQTHTATGELLKISDISRIFQVSKPTIYEWIKQDRLPSFKIRSRRYFKRADIERIMNKT